MSAWCYLLMSLSQCSGRAVGCLLDSPENPKQEEGGCDEEGELVIEPEWRVQCHQSAEENVLDEIQAQSVEEKIPLDVGESQTCCG